MVNNFPSMCTCMCNKVKVAQIFSVRVCINDSKETEKKFKIINDFELDG